MRGIFIGLSILKFGIVHTCIRTIRYCGKYYNINR
jgi:hypothetical protein